MKLFIPGPVTVAEENYREMCRPMIGHRSKEYAELHAQVVSKLQRLMYTKNRVFIFTSSSTGIMEACARNLVAKKALVLTCGAFSERWHKIFLENGKQADAMAVEWGRANKPDGLAEKLASGEYDVVAVVHNETSTGVMNPVKEIADVVREYPDVLLCVDTVSSMGGVRIPVDEWGIDVCFFGTQKDLGLPPGLAFCSVSDRAMARAETIPNRGAYFDFITMDKYNQKNNTPATPAVSLLFGVNHQLDRMFAQGLERRYAERLEMAKYVRAWAKKNFDLYPEPGYESNTLTVIKNTRGINVGELNEKLRAQGMMISNGYGKIKDVTFRIAHMAETTLDDIKELLERIDAILGL
ncbi:MAG: alanine--glyoxylate aminotransferase family protein [Candidatus Micrarchaeia archaeon]